MTWKDHSCLDYKRRHLIQCRLFRLDRRRKSESQTETEGEGEIQVNKALTVQREGLRWSSKSNNSTVYSQK